MEISHLHIQTTLWDQTLRLLRSRSEGRRESGAVLLGAKNSIDHRHASCVVGYHDLCDDRATEVFVELSEEGKHNLYSRMEIAKLQLVGMVHTHPESWVGLSLVDQANRLSSRVGFWSIVVPYFGIQPWDLNRMGFHIRQRRGWLQLTAEQLDSVFHLE